MSASSNQDFQDLKRLLALKRHEQPPPGYFNGFSREVISSIQAGHRGQGAAKEEANIALWIYSLLERFQARPSWAAAFGTLLCAAMIGAMIYMDQPNPPNLSETPLFSGVVPSPAPTAEPVHSGPALQPMTAGFVNPEAAGMDSTSPPSLFDIDPTAFFDFSTEPAGFRE